MLIIPYAISSFPISHPTPDILIPLLIATGYIRFHPNLDLRKLIKHEERLAENAKANNSSSRSLHQRGTVSSRAKLTGDKDKENTAPPPPSSCPCPQKEKESKTDQDNQREVGGAGFADLARIFKEKLLMEASVPPDAVKDLNPAKSLATGKRRSRSKTRKEPPLSSGGESDPSVNPTRMQRRRRSKSQPRSASRGAYLDRRRGRAKHCDPVARFQYYQKEWAHFRTQIPGETAHTNARFGVRHKLMDPK